MNTFGTKVQRFLDRLILGNPPKWFLAAEAARNNQEV